MKSLINSFNQNLRSRIALLFVIILSGLSLTAYPQGTIENGIKIFENKNYYGAQKFFTDFLVKNPDNAVAYYYLGRVAFENKDNDGAIDLFEKATSLDNSNAWFYTWKGINYITILQQVDFLKQGLYAFKAKAALEQAVGLDSMNALARTYLAGYYSQAPGFAGGSEEKAIAQINSAVAIDSIDEGIQLQRGLIMAMFKYYDDAKKSFESAMNLDPENYNSYFQMGKMSSEAGVYLDQGALCLERFVANAPKEFDADRDDAWWMLGNIYSKKGINDKAKDAYEKAISLNPDNEEYRKSLKNVM